MLSQLFRHHFWRVAFLTVLFATALAGATVVQTKNRHEFGSRLAVDGKGFAVVELFTSEGCSSCPPADELVARVQQDSRDKPVYILAFHVDYWDRLGWKDAFSNALYSQRQQQYATWFKLQSVYTPQIVVNGKKEFVGSQESDLRDAIKGGLQADPSAELTLHVIRVEQHKILWNCQAKAKNHTLSVFLAVVQRSATTKVHAGENNGRTLSHVQIVRSCQTVTIDDKYSGEGSLALPAGLASADAELIAFLQNNDTGEIMAATRSELPIH